jgi:hypothetical protein
MKDMLKMLQEFEDNAHKDANELWNKTRKLPKLFRHYIYKILRIRQFKIGGKFTYDGLNYEVLNIYKSGRLKYLVEYSMLNYDGRLAPSGRPMKRSGRFGIGSTMDLTLRFMEDTK